MGRRGGASQDPAWVGLGQGDGRGFHVPAPSESGAGGGVLHVRCLPHRSADHQGEAEEWTIQVRGCCYYQTMSLTIKGVEISSS